MTDLGHRPANPWDTTAEDMAAAAALLESPADDPDRGGGGGSLGQGRGFCWAGLAYGSGWRIRQNPWTTHLWVIQAAR